MARQKINYATEQEAKEAKKRGSEMHKQGYRPIHTDHDRNQWSITWSNDPEPPPPPPTPKTQAQLLLEIAKERNYTIVDIAPLQPIKVFTKKWWEFWK